MLPGFDECCRTRKIMVTMTRHGKRSTTPKGIEIFEFPLSRILRPKNDIFGLRVLVFSVAVPSEAIASVPEFDTRLAMLEVKPMPSLSPRSRLRAFVDV